MNRLILAGPSATTGASGTLNFVSLADFQAYIGEDSDTGGPIDTLKQTLLDSASRGAYVYMGGRFLLRPATEFDQVMSSQDNGDTLFLPQYPVGTISTLEIGYMSSVDTWTSQETVSSNNYYVEHDSGRVYGTWPLGLHTVRVVWPGGYQSANLPADAKEAVMMWAAVKLDRVRRKRWDQTSFTSSTESKTYTESDLPPMAAAILQSYSLATASIA